MKTRFLSLLLVLALLSGLMTVSAAARGSTTVEQLAEALNEAGLLQGSGTDLRGRPVYDLSKTATRAQAVTMLVRILGREAEALSGDGSHPFTDVAGWAKPYVAYAYGSGLTNGTSDTTFGSEAAVSAGQYLTFCLRALGYSSEEDFSYREPFRFAESVGFKAAGAMSALSTFTRAEMVLLSCDALLCTCKGTAQTLGQKLGLDTALLAQVKAQLGVYTGETKEKTLTYASLLEQVNAERRTEMSDIPESVLEVSLSHEYDTLLSHEECAMLIQEKERCERVTKAQAEEDAEYLWKVFASAYGGYYYFGDAAFQTARTQVRDAIRACKGDTISYETFDRILMNAYRFIRDNHSRFYQGNEYAAYYVKGLYLYEDTKGYYRQDGGEKWYLQSLDRGDLSDFIHVTIAPDGELVYGFYHRFLSGSDGDMPHTLTLTNGKTSRTLTLRWTKSEAVGWDESDAPERIFATENIDGHNVVKIRGFDYFSSNAERRAAYRKELNAYMQTGTTLAGQDYVIIDSRSNGGGSDKCPAVWMNRFLGHADASMESGNKDMLQFDSSRVDFEVRSRLMEYADGRLLGSPISRNVTEYPRERTIQQAEQTANEHPLFVLTDYLSGSAGEAIITEYRTVENVLIVGTNTRGCMFSNVQIKIYLPNTGYYVGFGQHAALEDFVNREGCGYDPDIWVPSEYALELTLKLCGYYGLTDEDAAPLPTRGEVPARVSLKGYGG